MTVVAYGDRMDAIEAMKLREAAELVTFDQDVKDNSDEMKTQVHEMCMAWQTLTIPRKQLVFVDPPSKLDPKKLKPRADRHVVFTGSVPAAWKRWAEASTSVQLERYGYEAADLVQLLVAGNPGAGVPKFTKTAAEHLVACNPGGLCALEWPVKALVAAEVPIPVQLESVMELWPVVPVEGKVYTVKLGDLIKTLGRNGAVLLASKVPEKESFGALMGLKVACKSSENRVKLIDALLVAIDKKRLKPDAALVFLTLACLEESTWPSKSKAGASPSPLLRTLSRLSNTPCSRLL